MEKLCTQLSTSYAVAPALPVATFPLAAEAVDEVRGVRAAAGISGSHGAGVSATSVPVSSVASRVQLTDTPYGGAPPVVLPHARRPSPRCFAPALSRRIASGGGPGERPSFVRLTSRPQTAAVEAALPPANSGSSTWAAAAAGSKKRTSTQSSSCSFPAVGAAPSAALDEGSDGAGAEQLSSSSSSVLDLGKSTTGKMLIAGSTRSSNSSVSTTAAAASSWGVSSEDGGDGTLEQPQLQHDKQQHEQEEQRPEKLFRSAESRCCFSNSGAAAGDGVSSQPPGENSLLLPDAAACLSSAPAAPAAAALPGRTTPLPLLSAVSSGGQPRPQDGAPGSGQKTSPPAAGTTAEAVGRVMSITHGNMSSSAAAAASTKKSLAACGLRSAFATAHGAGGRGAAAASFLGGADPLAASTSSLLKKHHKGGGTAAASVEKTRLLKLQQQQAKLRLKAVAALAAARGACSVAEAAAAAVKAEDGRRHDKKQSSLYAFASGAGAVVSSYSRHFPLSDAAPEANITASLSSGSGSALAETMLLHHPHVFSASRGTRGLRGAAVRSCIAAAAACSDGSTSAAAAAPSGVEKSAGGVYSPSRGAAAAAGYRCVPLPAAGGGGTALAGMHVRAATAAPGLHTRSGVTAGVSSAAALTQRRGVGGSPPPAGEGSASWVQPRTGAAAAGGGGGGAAAAAATRLLDKSFGGVSERCRLLICDTSAAYGEDAGIDNVHNTKLAQFCYDQAAFKADKAQPGDYTVNSRRLSPEGRDLLVCVMNKVAAQLAQNTAATAAASSNASASSAAGGFSSSQQARAEGATTPASDPLSPRAAATVAIAIQLFDRFMQVVYQNDLHYGIAAEHRLHPLHGLSAFAALPAATTSPTTASAAAGQGGAGGSGGAAAAAASSSGTQPGSGHHASSNGNSSGGNTSSINSSSNSVSYSLLNQLIAIACFCFADRVEAIYAYEYAAVLEAWRQQSPVGLTQAWKAAAAAAAGGQQGLSTAVLKEKLMHIERKIISHVPPSGGNVSVAPLSELAESLLNVAVQFAAAGPCVTGSSPNGSEDGALSEASTAPSPTSVSKSKENNGHPPHDSKSLQHQQQQPYTGSSSSKKQDTGGLSVLHRREALAEGFLDREQRENEALLAHPYRMVGAAASVAAACLSPSAGSRSGAAAVATRGNSGRRGFSAAAGGGGRGGRSVVGGGGTFAAVALSSSSSCASAGVAVGGAASRQKCSCCRREWLPGPSEAAALRHSLAVCRSCVAQKQQRQQQHEAGASPDAPLSAGDPSKTAGKTAVEAKTGNPYALRLRVSGSSCSDVPRLIAQLLVRLGQLDRRICLDFRPSVIAAAAVHIALLPRQGDPTQRFSPLSPAARAIAVKAVVAAGGAACYRLVRRCQSMLMHKWVKVRGAMALVQRSSGACGGSGADAATSAAVAVSGAAAAAGGLAGAAAGIVSGGGGSGAGANAAAAASGGRMAGSVSLPERLVAEWALSRLTLPAHRHMLEVLHQLADIWTTYAAASIRSKTAAAVAAAAAAAAAGRKQQQQQQQMVMPGAASGQMTTGSSALKRTAAEAEVEGAAAAADAAAGKGGGAEELLSSYKCSSSINSTAATTSAGVAGSHHYKHHYYHHRSGKGRSCSSSTSAEDLLLTGRKLAGEAARRRVAAGAGRAAAVPAAQGFFLKKVEPSSGVNNLGQKGKLLQPLNAALLNNTASLHAAVANSSINSFATLAGLQKELRMMERATTGLRRLQKLSLESGGR